MPSPHDYPVFEQWYRTVDWLLARCERMPKHTRFSISGRMATLALEITELLIEAVYTRDRAALLQQINLGLEKMRFFNRLCKDRRLFSIMQYEFFAREINKTGAMCGGWAKQPGP